MKSLFLILALVACAKPEYPVNDLPLEWFQSSDNGKPIRWSKKIVTRTYEDKETSYSSWSIGPDDSGCIEGWERWSCRKTHDGGEECIRSGIRIKRIAVHYGRGGDDVTDAEWDSCNDRNTKKFRGPHGP